jgi:putative transposase
VEKPRSEPQAAARHSPAGTYSVAVFDVERNLRKSSPQSGASPRRMHVELNEDGLTINRHRVARIMRDNDLKARQKTRFKKTTDSDHRGPVAINVSIRTSLQKRPTKNGASITRLFGPPKAGYILPSCWPCSRAKSSGGRWKTCKELSPCVSQSLASSIIPTAAANTARVTNRSSLRATASCHRRCEAAPLRGDERARQLLRRRAEGALGSDAMVETVFKTIKTWLIWRTAYTSRWQASNAIGQYIEGFYNPRRRHSTLGYISPATFETMFLANKKQETAALH